MYKRKLPANANASQELKSLELAGVQWEGRIKLSDRAHIVFDFHQTVDGKQETKVRTSSPRANTFTTSNLLPPPSHAARPQ